MIKPEDFPGKPIIIPPGIPGYRRRKSSGIGHVSIVYIGVIITVSPADKPWPSTCCIFFFLLNTGIDSNPFRVIPGFSPVSRHRSLNSSLPTKLSHGYISPVAVTAILVRAALQKGIKPTYFQHQPPYYFNEVICVIQDHVYCWKNHCQMLLSANVSTKSPYCFFIFA